MSIFSNSYQGYSRRKLLQLAGLALGSTAVSTACNAATTSPEQASIAPANPVSPEPSAAIAANRSEVSRVVLVRSEDRVTGTRRAIDLLQPEGISGQTVFLKPNYNTADPAPAATDTALLEALVQELQNAGAGSITIGDRSGMANTREAMQTKGVFQLADRYGLKAIVLDELEREDWQYFPAEGTHWSKGFAFARPALQAGAVVNTCCLKTHRFGGHFTLSLKNVVGLVAKYVPGDSYNYMGELHSSPHQRLMIAEANKVYNPVLVLLDGVEAFTDGGPESGSIAKPGVILAGTDRVAVDVVALGILRSLGTTSDVAQGSVWQLEQIQRAVELSLGAGSHEQIEIVTADSASQTMADQIRRIIAA
ncbi:DUF362 domain-containing protein [Leptolyngbya sp. NK1-12]|uniref:DUF362 domain-containing protein n=1 Tax=Leptolyngbya sp. NK1-12 TaxID=2547451 RepID=A0AA96WDK4_9CYAN|nr:DUF362 domain-containing protein [Leptolyngbya sp. NK1-12]